MVNTVIHFQMEKGEIKIGMMSNVQSSFEILIPLGNYKCHTANISQLQWTNARSSALPRDSLVALLYYHSFILLLQDLLPSFIFQVCQCIIQTFLMTNYKIISPLPKSWISKKFISSNDESYKITLHSSMNRLPGARNFFQYHLYFGMPRSSQGFILPL